MPQEWRPPVNGDDRKLVKALDSEKANKAPLADLKNILLILFTKIGLRAGSFPADVEKDILINHIIQFYGNHTTKEILLAFDMGIAGKLEFDEHQSINCFENFSCLYFSGVMNAYRKWAEESYSQLKNTELIEEKKELTPQERIEWMAEFKGKPGISIPVVFYEWMGLTDYTDNFEKSMRHCKRMIAAENESHNIKERKLQEFTLMETEGFTGEFKSLIENTAKKMSVYNELNK